MGIKFCGKTGVSFSFLPLYVKHHLNQQEITVMHGIGVMVDFCLKINKRYAWNKAVMVYHGPKIK